MGKTPQKTFIKQKCCGVVSIKMTLQESVEDLYVPMGLIRKAVEQTLESDYMVMKRPSEPTPNLEKLQCSVVTGETCCEAIMNDITVMNSNSETDETKEAKNQKLGEALGKLIHIQSADAEEPDYAYIDETENQNDSTTLNTERYQNVQDIMSSYCKVFKIPLKSSNNDDDDAAMNIERIPIRRPTMRKKSHKAKRVINIMDSVVESDEDKEVDDPQRPVTLKIEVDPDELDSRLMEMQEIVDRMMNVTPPPETSNDLNSVVVTNPQQEVPDDHLGNSTETWDDIINARHINRENDDTSECILTVSIFLAIFLFVIGAAFITFSLMQKKH